MKTRKFLSVLVAAVLLIATVSVIGILSVNAETVTVSSADELVTKIGEGETDIKLGANLDLTGIDSLTFAGTLDGNGKTVTVENPLFDTLSGEVKNLTIAGTITSNSTGAVGALANTVSGNLTVTNVTNGVSVTSTQNKVAGGFIGLVEGNTNFTVTFANCTNTGAVSGGYGVGGFVGKINNTSASTSDYSNVNFSYCLNDAAIAGKAGASHDAGTGGLVGFSKTRGNVVMTYCGNTENGIITDVGGDYGVGGLYGGGAWDASYIQKYDISYSYNKGSVTSEESSRPGGIVGRLNRRSGSVGIINYCYNIGTINGKNSTSAGILGYTNKNNVASISCCYTIGSLVTGSKGVVYDAGGEVTQTNNFTETDKDKLNEALLALTDSEYCVNPALNDGYAILKWQCVHSEPNCEGKCVYCAEVIGEAGDHTWSDWAEKTPATATHAKVEERSCSVCSGTEERTVGEALGVFSPVDGVYNVENETQLVWLVYQINEGAVEANVSIAIKNDITLTNGLDMITPTFSGKFDGEGNTISGLNNTMFKRTASGFTFTNVTLEGEIDYTEIGDAEVCRMAASVSLYAEGGYVLENVVSYVDIQSVATNLNAGGLLGFANQGQITNCTYGGTYTIDWTAGKGGAVGGLVGWLNDNSKTSYITNSYFTGNFTVANSAANDNELDVGGLVGRSRNSGSEIITGCVSNGSLTVTATGSKIYVGGLVGAFDGQKANDITNCVANNDISADAAKYGSFVGRAGGAIPFTNCISLIDAEEVATCGNGTLALTNCYYKDTIETIGDAFTMGGVEYQRYNFGYLNTATSALVSTGEVASNAIDAFISYRDNADKHDVRFVLLADLEALKDVNVANVSIVFTLGEDEVRVENGVFGGNEGTFVPYQAVLAADEPFFAAEGYAYFGLVMVDIPDGAWDSVTLTVTNAANDEVICTGTQTYAGIQE